ADRLVRSLQGSLGKRDAWRHEVAIRMKGRTASWSKFPTRRKAASGQLAPRGHWENLWRISPIRSILPLANHVLPIGGSPMRRFLGLVAFLLFTCIVATPAARPADEQQIKQAIQRGVDYLKGLQKENGSWPFSRLSDVGVADGGMTSLAGLAL